MLGMPTIGRWRDFSVDRSLKLRPTHEEQLICEPVVESPRTLVCPCLVVERVEFASRPSRCGTEDAIVPMKELQRVYQPTVRRFKPDFSVPPKYVSRLASEGHRQAVVEEVAVVT